MPPRFEPVAEVSPLTGPHEHLPSACVELGGSGERVCAHSPGPPQLGLVLGYKHVPPNDVAMQWSGVAGKWHINPLGRNLLSEAELIEQQRAWEADEERSDLFRQAVLVLKTDEFVQSEERSALFKLAELVVRQEEWEEEVDRTDLFLACKRLVEFEAWEDGPERSDVFDVSWNLVEQDEWEGDSSRSELFRFAKKIVTQEEWEDDPSRCGLFDVCWNAVEQEEWEDDPARSVLFDVCWSLVEEEDCASDSERSDVFETVGDDGKTLLLPPHFSRADLTHADMRGTVAPLSSVVVDNEAGAIHEPQPTLLTVAVEGLPLPSSLLAIASKDQLLQEICASQIDAKLPVHSSPSNVATLLDAFPPPTLHLELS